MSQTNQGFSVVELLVAIVIAVMILMAGSQVYSVALGNSGTAQRRAKASNVAYDLLRQAQSTASSPCTTSNVPATDVPSGSGLPGAKYTTAITCPFSTSSPNLSLITVTVTYNNPEQRSVTRAIVNAP